jgi:hypothetical protein
VKIEKLSTISKKSTVNSKIQNIHNEQFEEISGSANHRKKTHVKKKIATIYIQGVTKISALILTGNRTHQKEQLFSLPFWPKTLRNGSKK